MEPPKSQMTYTCAFCKETFLKGRPDAEALKEMVNDFGVSPDVPYDVICDDCYREFNRDRC